MLACISAGVIHVFILGVNILIEENNQAYYTVEMKSLGESG